ncbi:hypothetical protein PCA10_25530 [Metapseudomonas resinovorans NBRC 106553]|uniref:Uncharacterized protein n=1 Tax=Metapseudomonas resinovorans NBRC 106553 TaxID=1245471 RepID=S6AIP0_METRE|nr:hypothetical protein PCA10_25530 [Pseudomonas resinovorans NBRC 106553]
MDGKHAVVVLTGSGVVNWSSVVIRSPKGLSATRGYLDSGSAAITWSSVPHEFPRQTGAV